MHSSGATPRRFAALGTRTKTKHECIRALLYALQDWGQLQPDYLAYQAIAPTSSDLSALFKANAAQMTQRINLFADGTWFLLSAIFTAIGLHGFLTSQTSSIK